MTLLEAIMWCVLLGTTVVECPWLPLDYGLPNKVSTDYIEHTWFSSEDQRQLMVDKAYELWGLDFVLMLECENGNWSIKQVGDWGHSFGLCQMNNRRHNIPKEYYNSREYQIDYCYQKWSSWTKFYGPNRKINGQTCKNYVRDRFIIK